MKLLIPSVIELIGKLFLSTGARMFVSSMRGGGLPGPESFSALGPSLIGFLICVPAELWLTMLQLAYVRMLLNHTTDFDQAFKQVRHKFWAVMLFVIAYYIVFFVWIFVWAFLFGVVSVIAKSAGPMVMVPLAVAMLLMAIINLTVLLLPGSILFVVLACEDKNFFSIIGRAYSLTFKRFFPTAGFCSVLFVAWMSLYMALSSVLQVFYGAEYVRTGVFSGKVRARNVQMPFYVQVIGSAWNTIIYMYLMPVFFLSTGYYYYALRMRSDGLDIMHSIELLEKKRDAIA